jgi:hypothetical protein
MKIEITLYESEKYLERKIIDQFPSNNENIYQPTFLGKELESLNIVYIKDIKPIDLC